MPNLMPKMFSNFNLCARTRYHVVLVGELDHASWLALNCNPVQRLYPTLGMGVFKRDHVAREVFHYHRQHIGVVVCIVRRQVARFFSFCRDHALRFGRRNAQCQEKSCGSQKNCLSKRRALEKKSALTRRNHRQNKKVWGMRTRVRKRTGARILLGPSVSSNDV
jgi:hypothetical protein